MTHAYPEIYLNKTMKHVGEAFDYAVNICKISGDAFAGMLIVSGFADRIECGEPSVVVGRSGIELARDVICDVMGDVNYPIPETSYARSPEYWVGYVLAYYQWYSGRRIEEIVAACSFSELVKMYHPLHEADLQKTVDVLQKRMQEVYAQTRLQHGRVVREIIQREHQ